MRPPGSRALAALAAVLATAVAVALPAAGLPAAAAEPQWNVARIGGPVSARGVVVAVVDTGVDATHPALAGRVDPAIDLVGGAGGDPNGHGTHVAGTIAGADTDPGCGAIGVVPDARILPVRVLDETGAGSVDAVARGIREAADAGAAVINLSLGTDVVLRTISGSGLAEAIEYAWGKGAIPVLAAGNDGLLGDLFGSGYGPLPAVAVTATDNRDRVASYATSIGSAQWGVAAPGGDMSGEPGRDVLSSYPGRQCALSAGTSMSAPHVSGALAALRAAGYDPRAAIQRLLSTARDLGPAGPDAAYGHGLVDVGAALARAQTATPPTVTAAPAPEEPRSETSNQRSDVPPFPAAAPSPIAPEGDSTPTTTLPAGPTDPAIGEADATTSTTPSRTESGDTGGEVAATAEPVEDGAPAGLVVAAAAAVAIVGAGSGVAARRLRRGISGSGPPQL